MEGIKLCAPCGQAKPLSMFYVRDGKPYTYCKDCCKKKTREWASANKERKRAADAAYNRANKAKIAKQKAEYQRRKKVEANARKKEWRAKNIEKTRLVEQKYRDKNRGECNERIRAWKQANRHIVSEYALRRIALKLQAIPGWATPDKIQEFYLEARRLRAETGIDWHVDHIVPLAGRSVCGLHCEANLRVIPATENLKKNNRAWPDMP